MRSGCAEIPLRCAGCRSCADRYGGQNCRSSVRNRAGPTAPDQGNPQDCRCQTGGLTGRGLTGRAGRHPYPHPAALAGLAGFHRETRHFSRPSCCAPEARSPQVPRRCRRGNRPACQDKSTTGPAVPGPGAMGARIGVSPIRLAVKARVVKGLPPPSSYRRQAKPVPFAAPGNADTSSGPGCHPSAATGLWIIGACRWHRQIASPIPSLPGQAVLASISATDHSTRREIPAAARGAFDQREVPAGTAPGRKPGSVARKAAAASPITPPAPARSSAHRPPHRCGPGHGARTSASPTSSSGVHGCQIVASITTARPRRRSQRRP